MSRSTDELELIFGAASEGNTEEARAASSSKIFVRSQVQIAEASSRASGHRMSAFEAYRSYGPEILKQVASDGFASLVTDPSEPAKTLKLRRCHLNLSSRQLAKAAGVPVEAVSKAETPNSVSPIRDLEKIAQALALNAHLVGFQTGAGGDEKLGVRLREISQNASDVHRFSAADVLSLAEAAWVISTQTDLCRILSAKETSRPIEAFKPDSDYDFPTWEKGYQLAEATRKLLGISLLDPIPSIKRLIEETLSIPVIQQSMSDRLAGATISNDGDRGIVVNERGQNTNVWVRRMTMAHELGHLLWDSDSRLNRLKVDRYDELQSNYKTGRTNAPLRDVVETRTNAFAVSFLAPPAGISQIADQTDDHRDIVATVMRHYGLSFTAAKHHVGNILKIDVSNVRGANVSPSDEWVAAENMTVDWFPIADTPISRRGHFAALVALSFKTGLIAADTAALYLHCSPEVIEGHYKAILDANS